MTSREQFYAYRQGWKHGACANAKDPAYTEHDKTHISSNYEMGYVDGVRARSDAMRMACSRVGYNPQILR